MRRRWSGTNPSGSRFLTSIEVCEKTAFYDGFREYLLPQKKYAWTLTQKEKPLLAGRKLPAFPPKNLSAKGNFLPAGDCESLGFHGIIPLRAAGMHLPGILA